MDLTGALSSHPGGIDSILAHAGGDVSTEFSSIHPREVLESRGMFCIGIVEDTIWKLRPSENAALNPKRWTDATLVKKEIVSPDSRIFWFKFDQSAVGLPLGQHVLLGADIEHIGLVVRPYTPIFPVNEKEDNGTLGLLIKVYFPRDKIPGGLYHICCFIHLTFWILGRIDDMLFGAIKRRSKNKNQRSSRSHLLSRIWIFHN